tara:strand:+ start:114 stop:779 length:666 start_codon:yes stop_codon:yes gene_type:complete
MSSTQIDDPSTNLDLHNIFLNWKNLSITDKPPKNKSKTPKKKNIINKGTGAGGAKTNATGLSFEERTILLNKIKTIRKTKKEHIVKFLNNPKEYIKITDLFKYMELHNVIDKNIPKPHGCIRLDECYLDTELNYIFIIEKKFQQVKGSVCEKIQTALFKLNFFKKTFPQYNIIYIYCLSDWFKENCKVEIETLHENKIPIFWGNHETYQNDIINFIINYKQ